MRTLPAFLLVSLGVAVCAPVTAQSHFASSSPASSYSSTSEAPAAAPDQKTETDKVDKKAEKKSKDKKSKKHGESAEGPKKLEAKVQNGTLTVDGMIAKARLNYEVDNSFIYVYIPGTGTAIIAQDEFPGAAEQKKAFQSGSVKIDAGGHTIELANDNPLAGKEHDAWVKLDPSYQYKDARYPVVGFGDTLGAPYAWPGAKANADVELGSSQAPPVPKNLLPKIETVSNYSVTVKPVSVKR